jgi:hypothetical protein
MYRSRTYKVIAEQTFVPIVGTFAADVVVVDRNGIGVKHTTSFAGSASVTEAVTSFSWYAVKRASLEANEYLNVVSLSVTTVRSILYEVGSNVVEGRTYSVYNNNVIAKYTAQAGDTATDVRNGLKSAIDAASWDGFTTVTSSVSTNRLSVDIDVTSKDLLIYLGQQKWKKGYTVDISGSIYLVDFVDSTTTEPALPTLESTYNFTDLTITPFGIEQYLREPLSGIVFSEASAGTTEIFGLAGAVGAVPFNTCVVYEPEQRIYFADTLALGEVIKVFQK